MLNIAKCIRFKFSPDNFVVWIWKVSHEAKQRKGEQMEKAEKPERHFSVLYFSMRLKYSSSCNINTLCVFRQLFLMEVSFRESFQADERKE